METPLAAPQDAPRQAKVEAPPKTLKAFKIDYPRLARWRGEQGDVELEIAVDEKGAVTAVTILSSPGFKELETAAVKAARAAKFTPAMSGGRPIASTARITLSFKLR